MTGSHSRLGTSDQESPISGYRSYISVLPLWLQAKSVHTYLDPIGIIDLWKENPLGQIS